MKSGSTLGKIPFKSITVRSGISQFDDITSMSELDPELRKIVRAAQREGTPLGNVGLTFNELSDVGSDGEIGQFVYNDSTIAIYTLNNTPEQIQFALGHELGHVNERHTARQMSKGQLTNILVGGAAILAGTQSSALGQLTSQLGMAGAGALLASYSRDNEREADALGLEYMTKTGYNPDGFVELMDMLLGEELVLLLYLI